MDISEVRRRLAELVDRSKRAAAERRTRTDDAEREYAAFLDRTAVPLFRQVANALKVQGYAFTVFTPGGSVRLMSDRSSDDFVELTLDTSGDMPTIVGHTRRTRGRRVVESERPIATGAIAEITDDDLFRFLLQELEPFVER
jgi:hypothetical protein